MRQPLRTCVEELRLLVGVAHRRAAAGRSPDGRDDRADLQVPRPGLVGQLADLIVAGIDVDVRGVEEEVEAVEADALELGVGREVEHRIQVDRRLGPGAFADHARPGGVVKLGVVVGMFVGHGRICVVADSADVGLCTWDRSTAGLARVIGSIGVDRGLPKSGRGGVVSLGSADDRRSFISILFAFACAFSPTRRTRGRPRSRRFRRAGSRTASGPRA